MFINILKKSAWAIAFSAICDCRAANPEGVRRCWLPDLWSELPLPGVAKGRPQPAPLPGRTQLATEKLLKRCQFSEPNKLTFVLATDTLTGISPPLRVWRRGGVSVSFRHLPSFTARFGQLFGGADFLCWENWLLSSSPWFHASTCHPRGGAGWGSFPSEPPAPQGPAFAITKPHGSVTSPGLVALGRGLLPT